MDQQAKTDYLLHCLEEAGKRSTPQRHAVCQALVEHGGHPTVADIFEHVRATFPMISQATVYNTIDTLLELRLIRRLEIANHDHTHYDLDLLPHINVVCQHCEYIADVYLDALQGLLDEVSQRTGCAIDHHSGLIVYGVCPACQEAQHQHKPPEPCASKTGNRNGRGEHGSQGRVMRRHRRRANRQRTEPQS